MSGNVQASNVRTVAVNNDSMSPIYLKMGKSTVLRFSEKPKKVVIGNQNYYGLEFIENDVAIQPLGAVATNLFVYAENHTYGFLLTPGERYDDLVFVRWKYPQVGKTENTKPNKSKSATLNLPLKFGAGFRFIITKIQGPSTFGLHLIDGEIENISQEKVSLSKLEIRAVRSGKPLENQSIVFEADQLKPKEKTKARILLKIGTKATFAIEGKFGTAKNKILISGKYL